MQSLLQRTDAILTEVMQLLLDNGNLLGHDQQHHFLDTHKSLRERWSKLTDSTRHDVSEETQCLHECIELKLGVRTVVESALRASIIKRRQEALRKAAERAAENNPPAPSAQDTSSTTLFSGSLPSDTGSLTLVNEDRSRDVHEEQRSTYEHTNTYVDLDDSSYVEGLTINYGGHHQSGEVITRVSTRPHNTRGRRNFPRYGGMGNGMAVCEGLTINNGGYGNRGSTITTFYPTRV